MNQHMIQAELKKEGGIRYFYVFENTDPFLGTAAYYALQ